MSEEISEFPEDADPSVPPDLLELHVALEVEGVDPQTFKEVYGEASK